MKKTLMYLVAINAWIVGGLLLSLPSAHALEIYNGNGQTLNIFGQVQAGFMNKAARSIYEETEHKGGIEGDVRLGFIGRSAISTNISGIAHVEWDLNSWEKDDKNLVTRYAYTGFDFGPMGVLTIGQQDTATYQTIGFTDVFERWGSESSAYWALGGRQEGQVAYINAIGGYTLATSYQTSFDDAGEIENHDLETTEKVDVDYGFAGSLSYNWERNTVLKGLAFSVSADYYKFKDPIDIRGRRSFNVALSYGYLNDGFYTALLYSRIKHAGEEHHLTGAEVVAGYTFENGLGFMTGYNYKGYELHKTDTSYINAQVSYDVSPAMRVYAEGRFGVGQREFDLADKSLCNLWTLSAQYKF